MQYKTGAQRNLREIAQQLGVAHLVEGSVQKVANRVRVNAQLIDARNDAHLWAQTYDRDLADVFAIQSEIAKAIADQLQAKLSPAEKNAIEQRPTNDVAAFEFYSRAKDLILNTGFSAIRAQNVPYRAILLSFPRSASSPTRMINFTLSMSTVLLSVSRWRKLRCKRRSDCAPMQERRISPAPIIFISRIEITMVLWPNSRLFGAQCRMLLGFSN